MLEPEAKLMSQVAEGNFSAFREIVELYQRPLVAFILKFIGNRSEAEDIAQEVFLKVFRAAKDYKPKAKFKTWLFTIATNVCLNEIRANKRNPQFLDIFQLNESGFLAVASGTSSPEKEFENKELCGILRKAIAGLPENQRIALLLQKYSGFSYGEIGNIMSCSVPAVESLIQRARQSLKKILSPYI